MRDTLYDELTATRRMRLHRSVGEALEALYATNPDPHLTELAHHFHEAVPAADAGKAIEYARRAGDRAATLLAYEEAARLYEIARVMGTDAASVPSVFDPCAVRGSPSPRLGRSLALPTSDLQTLNPAP